LPAAVVGFLTAVLPPDGAARKPEFATASSVIASEAKQSISAMERKNGLLRRCAPRNDG
jgi:hypothetical protein